jgi:hypothetical protein
MPTSVQSHKASYNYAGQGFEVAGRERLPAAPPSGSTNGPTLQI